MARFSRSGNSGSLGRGLVLDLGLNRDSCEKSKVGERSNNDPSKKKKVRR